MIERGREPQVLCLLPKNSGEELHKSGSLLTLNSFQSPDRFWFRVPRRRALKGKAMACLLTNETPYVTASTPWLGLPSPQVAEEELFKGRRACMEVLVRAEDILTEGVGIHLAGEGKEEVLVTGISPWPCLRFLGSRVFSSSTFCSYLSLYSYLEKEIVLLCVDGGSVPWSGQTNGSLL